MLDEGARRGPENGTQESGGKPDALALNVGAPDCIDIELAKLPSTTGAPGRTSWTKVMPPSASARVWAQTPAVVTGAIAPARINGVIRVAWLASA